MQTSIGLPPVHVAFLPGSENLQPESWAETAEGPGADVLHRTNRLGYLSDMPGFLGGISRVITDISD